MGDAESKRDRLAAGRVLTSLFVMEIAPGGTNFPHHHEREEEIYLVLSGHGDVVAGGGMDGLEGRHPAKTGDAYFFRLNRTVGYYSAANVKSRILAVRSWYPACSKRAQNTSLKSTFPPFNKFFHGESLSNWPFYATDSA
jgi:hypothetical protein